MLVLDEYFFAKSSLVILALSLFLSVFQLFISKKWLKWMTFAFIGCAASGLIVSLIIRSFEAGFFALSNMYEALMMSAVSLLLAYLVMEQWFKISKLGWIVCMLALIIMFYAGSLPTEINPLQAALRSYWRSIHVPPILLSYGFFTLAFISSIALLISKRTKKTALPLSLLSCNQNGELYDEVTYRCIAAGFPLLMAGVILGAVWANEAWGSYWSWDPKESMSLVTLLGYGVYLHMRINGEHSKLTMAWVSISGFILVILTFIGVNMWGFGSLHSYGST